MPGIFHVDICHQITQTEQGSDHVDPFFTGLFKDQRREAVDQIPGLLRSGCPVLLSKLISDAAARTW